MSRVSVVIPHFFAERRANLARIAEALRAGTVKPVEIIVWNNDAPLPSVHHHVSVIQSFKNVGPKARFLAALVARGDYVLFQDNDVTVLPKTIENLLLFQHVLGGAVSVQGRVLGEGSYQRSPKLYGHGLDAPVGVDCLLGRMDLIPRGLLPSILSSFPWEETTEMDDIWFSACAVAAGVPLHVVPTDRKQSDLVELMDGIGACRQMGFYAKREAVLKDVRSFFEKRSHK